MLISLFTGDPKGSAPSPVTKLNSTHSTLSLMCLIDGVYTFFDQHRYVLLTQTNPEQCGNCSRHASIDVS